MRSTAEILLVHDITAVCAVIAQTVMCQSLAVICRVHVAGDLAPLTNGLLR